MSDQPYDDEAAGGLGTALADLASSVTDDPGRLASVAARVRTRRLRRRVRRTAVLGAVAVATVATVAALTRPPHEPAVTSVAADPSPTETVPDCRAALAGPPPEAHQGIKGLGTVVVATDQSVTIHLDAPGKGEPAELTATITAGTEWADGSTATDRPPLATGTHVGFAAEETDGGYQLAVLETTPVDGADPTGSDVDAAKAAAKAAKKDAPEPDAVKAAATITAVTPGSLSLHIGDGPLAGQDLTATTGPGTVYIANGWKCSGTDLAAGDSVRVALAASATGDYAAEAVTLVP